MNWINVKLKEVASVQGGFAFSSSLFVDKGIPVIRIGDIVDDNLNINNAARISDEYLDNYKDVMLEENDILIALTGATVGKTGIVKKEHLPSLLNQRVGRFIIKNRNIIDKGWIKYWLKLNSIKMHIINTAYGGGQPNISPKQIEDFIIPLPPLSEQRRIVEILDQADEIRKLRKQANEKAEKIIPALFYEMFGDIKSNPKKFRKEKMGDVLKVRSGNSLTSAMMNKDGKYPVYGGNGINGYHNQFMFDESKIVIGRVGAYCGNVFYTKPKSWITDNALYVSEKTSDLIDEFLVYQLKVLNLNQYAGRAGQPLISGNRIYPIEIIIPEKYLQDNFVKRLNNFENTFELRAKSSERINQLFDLLLSRAFDGSLTASWREANMKELLKEMEDQKKYLEGKINA